MTASFMPALPCMCGSFRRTSRALTQLYDRALRPLDLSPTQLTILQVLSRTGEVSQGLLGEMLAMDSTSLTRTLAIMVRQRWVTERRGEDRREHWLHLSSAGERQLKHALPLWEKVQSRLRRQIGDRAWNDLLRLTLQVTDSISTKGKGDSL